MDVPRGKSNTNGGCSTAVFDYRMIVVIGN
jgi:hypothetical protein